MQIKEERRKKFNIKNEIKEIPTLMTYGPQETVEISKLLKDRKVVEQEFIKKGLVEQMDTKRKD